MNAAERLKILKSKPGYMRQAARDHTAVMKEVREIQKDLATGEARHKDYSEAE